MDTPIRDVDDAIAWREAGDGDVLLFLHGLDRRGHGHPRPGSRGGGLMAGSDDLVRVAVDQELCIGGGICEMLEPQVFELDDDIVISSVTGDGLLPRQRADVVVDRCPGQAISIVEKEA